MGIKKQSNVGHAYKCSGIPFYPKQHSMFKKRIEGQSREYIKSREKRVVDFLNRHGFDLDVDED